MMKLLWVDDEIDHFKSHILFLNNRGYDIDICISGQEAIKLIKLNTYDAILIDQNMPGLSGTETLDLIKEKTLIPVIMISQNSEESTVEEAFGLKVNDYLIKPLSPTQILLSLTKIFKNKELITNKTISNYQKNYQEINSKINYCNSIKEWIEIYKILTYWELEISQIDNNDIYEIIESQKKEANRLFGTFIEKNYKNILLDPVDEKHMPPKGKPQITDQERILLEWWINTGASFDKKVKELPQTNSIPNILLALQNNNAKKVEVLSIPEKEVAAADEKAINGLKNKGVTIVKVALNSNYLNANFITLSHTNDTIHDLIEDIKENLVWIKMPGMQFTDALTEAIA